MMSKSLIEQLGRMSGLIHIMEGKENISNVADLIPRYQPLLDAIRADEGDSSALYNTISHYLLLDIESFIIPALNKAGVYEKYKEFASPKQIEPDAKPRAVNRPKDVIEFIRWVKEFNLKMSQGGLKELMYDYTENIQLNGAIAGRFLSYIAEKLGCQPNDIEHKNRSKESDTHFQMVMYLDNGNELWATFIVVNDKHQIIANATDIQLLDSELNTLREFSGKVKSND